MRSGKSRSSHRAVFSVYGGGGGRGRLPRLPATLIATLAQSVNEEVFMLAGGVLGSHLRMTNYRRLSWFLDDACCDFFCTVVLVCLSVGVFPGPTADHSSAVFFFLKSFLTNVRMYAQAFPAVARGGHAGSTCHTKTGVTHAYLLPVLPNIFALCTSFAISFFSCGTIQATGEGGGGD
ncbi:unnamed protein product [Ectocarpus sp. 6 AP-2014]